MTVTDYNCYDVYATSEGTGKRFTDRPVFHGRCWFTADGSRANPQYWLPHDPFERYISMPTTLDANWDASCWYMGESWTSDEGWDNSINPHGCTFGVNYVGGIADPSKQLGSWNQNGMGFIQRYTNTRFLLEDIQIRYYCRVDGTVHKKVWARFHNIAEGYWRLMEDSDIRVSVK